METEELIKLILGILVVVAVAIGISFFFKDKIIDFFKGISGTETFFLGVIK